MSYIFTPYIGLLIISGLMTLSLGIYTLVKYRHVKAGVSFAISMFIVTLWSIPNALEMSSTVLESKLFFANMQYIAYCYSPVILLILCLVFTKPEKSIRLNKLFFLFIIPTITVILVWTDKYHGLVRTNIHLDYSGAFPVIRKQYGPFFYVHALHSHVLNLTTISVLLKAMVIRRTIYKKQVIALLIGVCLIVFPNILYITGFSPIKTFDITPVFFGPSGLIMAWSILRYRMFDLIPLAWAAVIENMEAGVMVLDLHDRVLDINPAFSKILGASEQHIMSKNINEISEMIPKLKEAILEGAVSNVEFSMTMENKQVEYEAQISMLKDRDGYDIGRFVVAYDITDKKRAEREYYERRWRQAVKDERQRMARDLHDNLGQVLGFINLQAQAVQKELIDSGELIYSKKLDKLIEVAQSTHQQIRDFIHDVRNSELIELDFIAALDKELSNFEIQTVIKVTRRITPEFKKAEVPPDIRIHILNIIKEALNNVRKHARAGNVYLTCDYVDRNIIVVIKDDGQGFDTVNIKDRNHGFGLKIIEERTAEMGGQLEIKSRPGEGCLISVRIPLDRRDVNAI